MKSLNLKGFVTHFVFFQFFWILLDIFQSPACVVTIVTVISCHRCALILYCIICRYALKPALGEWISRADLCDVLHDPVVPCHFSNV